MLQSIVDQNCSYNLPKLESLWQDIHVVNIFKGSSSACW